MSKKTFYIAIRYVKMEKTPWTFIMKEGGKFFKTKTFTVFYSLLSIFITNNACAWLK